MVNLLVKNAKIIDRDSKFNGKKMDILIKGGKIEKIGKSIKSNYKTVEEKDLCVSLGWYDLRVNFRDPGHEFKEDLNSGLRSASVGGFTRVCVSPNTEPPVSNKSSVEYLLSKSKANICDVSVMGSITKDLKGEEMSEMYDMHKSGAVIFGEDQLQLRNTALMNKALLYAKSFQGTIVSNPMDVELSSIGQVSEGKFSTAMGLRGIPSIAESVALQRDIELLKYSGGKLHIAGVSTAQGVELIKKAKKKGLNITCDVDMMHLVKTDESVLGYNVQYKVSPPLRSEKDRISLVKAVLDDTIDCIVSNHQPEDVEHKKIEFSRAAYGVIMLESFFGVYGKYLRELIPLEKFIEKITYGPYSITNENLSKIEVGEEANLTLFNPKKDWLFTTDKIFSKSNNSPFIDEILVGKVYGVLNNNQTSLNKA